MVVQGLFTEEYRLWHYGTLNPDGILGVFLDVVQEEPLNAALMEDDLLEA
jgi:hypothetical protein